MKAPIPEEFNDLMIHSKSMDESKDCAVKAVCVVTGLPYREAHDLFARFGRRRRKGTPKAVTWRVLEHLGCKLVDQTLDFHWCDLRTTAGLRGKIRKDRRYLVFVDGHVAGVKDGKVIDWTHNRRHRIKRAYLVL